MKEFSKITSTANPQVKKIGRLRERKERDASGLTIVEGVAEVALALASDVVLKEVWTCLEMARSKEAGVVLEKLAKRAVPMFDTSRSVYEKISYGERQEGLLAVCETPRRSLADLKPTANPLYIVVEQVEKPGNLGAILRTCDSAGVNGLIVSDPKTDIYNPNVVRASLGTVFSCPVVAASNDDTLKFLKRYGAQVLAAVVEAKTVYTKIDMKTPLAIVLGTEHEGLSEFWLKNADLKARIPMKGAANSLNVSTTAAILIYEVLRQRKT